MDQYPRLRVTAAQLVLFAHVMISTTAVKHQVKHHKYSLASNVQSDGVNGEWTANVCDDCVTSSMSEYQRNEKKEKSGNCLHKNQTKVLVAHKECPDPDCMVWECLYLNCDLFKFDPNKPNVECTDCSMEPTITHDCGCRKWKCEKRRCVGEEYDVIETCPDECSVPVTKEKCGCTTYSCEYDKPPPSKCNMNAMDGCNECEKCVSLPYRGPACTKTGFKVEVCEKNCKSPKMCDSECEVAGPAAEDQCGCPIQNCIPIDTTCSSDGDCDECEECVVADISSDVCAKRHGRHMSKESKKCKRKSCPNAKDAMCDKDKCEYKNVRLDKCGCEVHDCTGNPKHQCNSDDDCNDECKPECRPRVVCEFGGIKVDAKHCQKKDVPVPPCNKTCEKLFFVPDECGVNKYTCESICPPVVEAECTSKCERPVTENIGECDCPTSVCRAQKDPPKPEEEPVCQEDCVGCRSCQWIQSEECGIWEQACLRTECPTHQPPLNLETCYEKIQKDECLCEMEPAKKPCVKLPTDQCPPGKERCPANSQDVCGCPQHLCCPIPTTTTTPTPPTPCESEKCNSCQSVLKYGPIKSGGCQDSMCEQKLCPAIEEITCEPCHEIKPVVDECGCHKYACKPVECTKDNPCQSGQLTDTFRDQCNCERIHCTTPVPPTPTPCPCGEMCKRRQCIKCD